MTTTATPHILILGATGGIGQAAAHAFLRAGWRVRALTRRPNPAADTGLEAVQWLRGDAMNEADVVGAARGVDVILHAVNPPRYRRWRELALPMLEHSIAAARASGARILLPGNVYNFGPDAGTLVDERSPQHPRTRKGAVRVDMEQRLRSASAQGVRSLVVRAGDFFGSQGASSWFTSAMVRPGRPLKRVFFPGRDDVGHAWAYLPDLAQTFVRLAQRERELPDFDVYHFGGHWLARNDEMTAALRRACHHPRLRVIHVPWTLVALLRPFSGLMRELHEMRYLWREPLRLDNRKLLALLGTEPHTPLDDAVAQCLAELGCLPQPGSARTAWRAG